MRRSRLAQIRALAMIPCRHRLSAAANSIQSLYYSCDDALRRLLFQQQRLYSANVRLYALDVRQLRSVPRRNSMAPPELARDAPGLDVFHPVEIGLFPVLRNECGLAFAHGLDRRLRKRLGVDVPLVGQIAARSRRVDRSPCGTMCVCGFDLVEQAGSFQTLDDCLARLETINAMQLHRLIKFR